MWEIPRPGIKLVSPCIALQTLNHCTTREALNIYFLSDGDILSPNVFAWGQYIQQSHYFPQLRHRSCCGFDFMPIRELFLPECLLRDRWGSDTEPGSSKSISCGCAGRKNCFPQGSCWRQKEGWTQISQEPCCLASPSPHSRLKTAILILFLKLYVELPLSL